MCIKNAGNISKKRRNCGAGGPMNSAVLNHCRATRCACTVWITGCFAEELSCCTDEDGFRRCWLCVLATSSLCETFHFVPSRWEGRFFTGSISTVAAFWSNCALFFKLVVFFLLFYFWNKTLVSEASYNIQRSIKEFLLIIIFLFLIVILTNYHHI